MTTNQQAERIPVWDGRSHSLELFRERVRLYVMGTKKDERIYCAARLLSAMDPDADAFKVGSQIDMTELEKPDGAFKVVDAIIAAQGPQTMQEAIKLFKGIFRLQRRSGESMQKWTTRFKLHVAKTGRSLHQCQADISATAFLHDILLGILLLEGSYLTPQEQASVLATSGKIGDKGSKLGNSYALADIIEALVAQWSEDELVRRDRTSRGRASAHAASAASSYPASSWDMVSLQESLEDDPEAYQDESGDFVGYDEAENYHEEEEELTEDFAGYEDAAEVDDEEAAAQQQDAEHAYASAARTFSEAKDLLARVRAARGYFPVVGVAAWDGDGESPRGRSRGRSSAAGRRGGRGRGGGRDSPGRSSYRPPPQPPAKMRQTARGTGMRGGRHHGPRRGGPAASGPGAPPLAPDQCLLCRQHGHRAADCPNAGGGGDSSRNAKRAFGSFVGMGHGEPLNVETLSLKSDEWEPLDDEFVGFDMHECDGLGLLDGGATRTVGSCAQLQSLVDQAREQGYDVDMMASAMRFTFAGGDQEYSQSTVALPVPDLDGECIKVQTVANEATPVLLGVDTLRKLGLVIDYAHDRAYSYTLQKMIPVVCLPSGHLAVRLGAAPGSE